MRGGRSVAPIGGWEACHTHTLYSMDGDGVPALSSNRAEILSIYDVAQRPEASSAKISRQFLDIPRRLRSPGRLAMLYVNTSSCSRSIEWAVSTVFSHQGDSSSPSMTISLSPYCIGPHSHVPAPSQSSYRLDMMSDFLGLGARHATPFLRFIQGALSTKTAAQLSTYTPSVDSQG